MQSLEVKSSTFAGCQSLFLLYFFLWIGFSDRDLRGWPVEPRGPPLLALRWPRTQLNTEERPSSPPDKRATMACSPLMSPAKRTGSTLGPLGFIYPFLFWPRKESTGASSLSGASAVTVWPHHTHTHTAFHIPKELHVAFFWFTLSVFIFSLRHWSVMFQKRYLAGINRPQYNLKAFPKKTSHVNAASQAREWLKLKGRLSSLNPKMGIPVLPEILSSSCRKGEKEAS